MENLICGESLSSEHQRGRGSQLRDLCSPAPFPTCSDLVRFVQHVSFASGSLACRDCQKSTHQRHDKLKHIGQI